MANMITGSRILLSLLLLCFPVLSRHFYACYLLAGVTDMVDGTVARLSHTESDFGSRLDTAADLCFGLALAVKILPEMRLPSWIWGWIAAIAMIKVSSIVEGMVKDGKLPAVHSPANKVTGILVFLLPLTMGRIDATISAAAVCVLATVAAIQERYIIFKR